MLPSAHVCTKYRVQLSREVARGTRSRTLQQRLALICDAAASIFISFAFFRRSPRPRLVQIGDIDQGDVVLLGEGWLAACRRLSVLLSHLNTIVVRLTESGRKSKTNDATAHNHYVLLLGCRWR